MLFLSFIFSALVCVFCIQRVYKGGKVLDRLRKKLCEHESLLLLMSPCMAFRVNNRNGKVNQNHK